MIKKTIQYEDLDGNTVSEDFYFHLSKLDLAELDLSTGGLENIVKELGTSQDAQRGYKIFKDLMLNSYGVRSLDGRRFLRKDPETGRPYRDDLEASPALGEIILELLADANGAADFVKGLLPAGAQKAIAEEESKGATTTDSTPELPTAPPVVEKAEPTDEELLAMNPQDMTPDQLRRAFALKSKA